MKCKRALAPLCIAPMYISSPGSFDFLLAMELSGKRYKHANGIENGLFLPQVQSWL